MGERHLGDDAPLDDTGAAAKMPAESPVDDGVSGTEPLDDDATIKRPASRRAAPEDEPVVEPDPDATVVVPRPRRAQRAMTDEQGPGDAATPGLAADAAAAGLSPALQRLAGADASGSTAADVPQAEIPSDKPGKGPKRPHGKHWKAKVVLIIVLCVALVTAGLVALFYNKLNNRIDRASVDGMLPNNRPPVVASAVQQHSVGDPFAGQAQNILVIGSDSRAGANSSVSNDTDDGQRSDTTFILHVSADRTRVQVVSIPRDTLITIPQCVYPDGTLIPQAGYTRQKFNSAFAYASSGSKGTLASGVACTIRAVEAMSNVSIDHYVVIDFAGFAQIVSAIGGVQLYLWCAVKSPDANNLSLPAGLVTLDGDTATNYARARKGQGLGDGSDLMRIQRQQALFDAVAKKVMGMNLLTNIDTLYNFLGSVADAVTTDPHMGSIADMAGFAYSLRNFSTSDLTFTTIPIQDAGDGANVVLVPNADAPIWTALATDTPIPGQTPSPSTGAQTSGAATPTSTGTATVASSSGSGSGGSTGPSIPPGVVTAPRGQC